MSKLGTVSEKDFECRLKILEKLEKYIEDANLQQIYDIAHIISTLNVN